MDLNEMMREDAESQIRVPTDEDLNSVAQLARRQYSLETLNRAEKIKQLLSLDPSVPELEAALKAQQEALTQVKEVDLPNAIQEFGFSEFKLLDGTKIKVKEEVYSAIAKENSDAAFKWLRDSGNDGLIKNEVKTSFGKGQDDDAAKLLKILEDNGITYTNSRSVHPMTLRAFVRKQIENGAPIPADLFSIHVKKVASIEVKKGSSNA